MLDRLTYALIGLVFGALLGVVCWWLYGLGFSVHYQGPGLDPVLKHWVQWLGLGFAAVGFVCRAGVGDAVGGLLALVFHVESDTWPSGNGRQMLALVLLVAVVAAAAWWMPR